MKSFLKWISVIRRPKFHVRINTNNPNSMNAWVKIIILTVLNVDILVHLKAERCQTLTCSKYIYMSKWVDRFWLVKALSCIVEGGQNDSQNQSKMPLCAQLVQQSKTGSRLILTTIATCHRSSAILGGLTTQWNKISQVCSQLLKGVNNNNTEDL